MTAGATRIDHVAIAVRDLDAAIALYRDVLGLPFGGTEVVEDQAVTTAFFGEEPGRIELLCPTRPDSPVGRFLDKRGEGLHHVAVRVTDIEAALESLKAAGTPLVDEKPRTGAHGTRVAFLHPKGMNGVLLELVQLPEEDDGASSAGEASSAAEATSAGESPAR